MVSYETYRGAMNRQARDRDRRGAGGNIATGIRKVQRGGIIKFDGFRHQDAKLEPLQGEWVRVCAEDAFFNRQVAIFGYHGGFICYAKNIDGIKEQTCDVDQ